MARSIECRACRVERQLCYIADLVGITAVVVVWLTGLRITTDTDYALTLYGGIESPNFDKVLAAGLYGESDL
jgi:hypothetical protein